NRPPAVVGEIRAQTIFLGEAATVDASPAFSDPDGDELSFAAASSDTASVLASVSGSEVTLEALKRGTATVTVTARDADGLEATVSFEVTVPNRPPAIVGEIEAQTIFLGEAATVDASPAFSDPDGDELSFAAASSDTASVLASVSGSEVTLEALKRGTATVTVAARDADSLEATVSFEVTVPNRPPAVVGEIRAQTIFLGEAATVDVSAAFGDPDGDPLTFEASSSDTAVVRASSSGSEITLEGLGRGDATVSVTARDTHGGEVDQSFEVAVPNRPPAATGELPPQTLLPGETVTVDVSTAFSDPDGDSLAFEATSSNLGVLGVSLADRVGEVTLEGVARGTATVSVTARDPDGADAGQRFEVTVRNRNPVVVSDLPPRTLLPGQTVTVDVAGVFRDPDGDPLTFEASSSDTEVAAVSAIASEVTVRGVSKGTATVTVTARDDHGGDVRQSFSVKVPNRRPVISGAIPAQTVEEGATTTVDVASYFSDPDGDALDFGASSSNAAVADVSTSGSGVTIEGVTAGSASVTVAARDPDGGEARQSFGVTVRPPPPPNQRPVVSSAIPAQTVRENASVSVDLDGHFRDPEGGALDYGATSSDEGVATADISGSDVVVGGVREGTATVTVTATDPGGLSADQEFGVTVRPPPPPNQRPVVSSAIPAQTVRENASVSVDLDGHFRDPEGGALDYDATSSNEEVATADISGSDVVVGGVSEGMATVTVTATDPGGLQAQQQFGVTVEAQGSTNQAPEVTGTIADRTAIRGGELPVQPYRYFSDPDDDELSYTAGTSNAPVATVRRSSPAVFYVTAVSDGQATITVTAQDPGGLTASTSFTFAVGNNAPRVTAEAPAVTSSPGQIDTLILRRYLEENDVGDELDFSASSTNSGVASVSVQFSAIYGFYADVRGVTAGEATITMTATDRGGLTASTSSLVTVTANRPPRITQGIGNQTLAVNDTLTWNLSDHFSDPDNDRLTYTAAGGIRVSASVTDSTFTVVGASAGISPVRVTATDPSGRTAEITFLAFVTASQSIEGLASSSPRRRARWTDAVAKDRAVLVGVSPSGHRRADR
ncbi:Ig-like domain-containing protein, partial [Candidatus Palauibacter sp.]|uniref:Ig-like domain-containing protein n=1 Tax=Candidatus Palauibacter sp. TaxID=3101350 RepID=UPI003B016EC2